MTESPFRTLLFARPQRSSQAVTNMLRLITSPCLLLAAQLSAQTPICVLQGIGEASSYAGASLTTSGIVTVIHPGLGGFFIEDPDCDTDAATSNGLFVYCPGSGSVQPGQWVHVLGTVQEYGGSTEISVLPQNITVIGSGAVTPTDIELPFDQLDLRERYEGMLVHFPQVLMVTDNDHWYDYGELTLAPARPWEPTDVIDPNDADPEGTTSTGASNVTTIDAAIDHDGRSTIKLDDGSSDSYPEPLPLLGPEGTLRCGSTISGLTGAWHQAFGDYTLEPMGAVALEHALRPMPPVIGGDVRISAFNTHNYWSTLGGFGAANADELLRQRTKLVAALFAMDADAYVLCEVEKNDEAQTQLLDALNNLYGGPEFVGISTNVGFGTKSVILYRSSRLTPWGPLDWLYNSTFERAHISQAFTVNGSGARFLLSAVHPKSKVCSNAEGADADQGDGQGCYNQRRRDQALALSAHWADLRAYTGIEAQLIVGDFNSFTQEDPLDILRAAGLQDLVPADDAHYSFRFGGAIGALDHAFATPAMAAAVSGARPWAINADEPPALDYPDAYIDMYQPNAYRSSDHDPVLVGVNTGVLGIGTGPGGASAVVFTTGADGTTATWSAAVPFRVQVLDALGRRMYDTGYISSGAVHSGPDLATGAYIWRCMDRSGAVIGTGKWVVR